MKNGEEVVSVGGAVDPSLKNVGTSASNSVLLDLGKVGVRGWTHSLNLSDIGRETECGCSCCEADWWRQQTGRQDILHSQARPRVKMCQPAFSCYVAFLQVTNLDARGTLIFQMTSLRRQ